MKDSPKIPASVFRTLWPYIKPYRGRLGWILLATMAVNGLALLPPLVFRYLVDDVVQVNRWHLLPWVLTLYLATPILAQGLGFANTQNIVLAGQRLVTDVRVGMYRLLLRLSTRYHSEHPTGGMITRLMGDVSMVQQLVTGQTVQLIGDILVFGFSLFIAFTIRWELAVGLVGVTGLYSGAYHYFAKRISKASQSMREVNDELMGRLQETLEGVRHVRLYNQEYVERELYLQRTRQGQSHAFESGVQSVTLSATCNAIAGYGSTVIYAISGYYVLTGSMSLGDLLALNTYVWMALGPAVRLTAFSGQLAEIRVSLRRVVDVLSETPDIQSPPGAPPMVCQRAQVRFEHVYFSYKPDEALFEDFNLEVPGGSSVALVGASGCGKTTLTSLVMRFWDVKSGRILIDGQDIHEVDVRSLRRIFGVVLQEPVIFEGTIDENIRYGRPGATRAEVEAAARAAEVMQFADSIPGGLDAVLGSNGIKLSVGQKQRVSIARALLRDPRILMLDEATSALDSEAEAAIQRAIARVQKGRTSFVVAHRLSTITGADLIVVLDRGRIVEKGRHEDLLQITNGVYRKLYEKLRAEKVVHA